MLITALSLFWDIVTGLPWTPNGVGSVGSLEPRGYCIFLPGAHYLTINSPHGADSSLNILLLLLLLLLDYCNSLLAGIGDGSIDQLQTVLRVAARLVLHKRKFDSISADIPDRLHWLPISSFDQFEIVDPSTIWLLISSAAGKSCELDPDPSWVIQKFADKLSPFVAPLSNASMSSGSFQTT